MYRAGSSARPLWFALFEECFDPFAEIVALADAGVFADGSFDLRIEFRACMVGEQALGVGKGERTVLRQLRGELAGPAEQLLWRHDFVDQAHLQGFGRVEDTAGQQEVASDLFTDLPQQKGGDDGRHESDADLGVTKFGIWYGEREVAEQRKSGAAGDGRSVYSGDCRPRKFI